MGDVGADVGSLDRRRPGFAGLALAGCCATLLGIGLQRFAYAPLLPAMVKSGWLPADQAGLLGALNFAGYLLGGLGATVIARRFGVRPALRGSMATAAVCFALCAEPWGFAWLAPWRTLAGVAGGCLMVLTGPAIQSAVAPERRSAAGGFVFMGVGLGVVVGAAIVPVVLPAGLSATWLALAVAGGALTAISWRFWPDAVLPASAAGARLPLGSAFLIASYAMAAVAATPHMAWWPDYIARGLGWGTEAGALYWIWFGLGAVVGPSMCGALADRAGAGPAMAAVLLVQVLSIAAPLVTAEPVALGVSAAITGAGSIGMTVLALMRSRELAGPAAAGLWRWCTVSWGAAQVGTGFLVAHLYAVSGSHLLLFGFGAASAVVALALAAPGLRGRPAPLARSG